MACYSQQQAELIAQHIPYVIGMNAAILDQTSIEFSEAFYDAVGAKLNPDYKLALDMGCLAIEMDALKAEYIPVLYKNGKLVSDGD